MATYTIKQGHILTVVTDALTKGSYFRIEDPANTATGVTTFAASSTTTIGPFTNEQRYQVDSIGNGVTVSDAFINEAADIAGRHPLVDTITVKSSDGAVTVADGIIVITKAGVCALTLAAPTLAQNGIYLNFISTTANAHTLTATGLVQDGTTGGPHDLITFAAFAGAGVMLLAYGQKWCVVANNNVTVS